MAARPRIPLNGHPAAALGAAAASLDAFLHLAHLLAALRALFANLGPDRARALVELGPELHEVGAGPADLGAGQHQPEVPWLDVPAAHVQAVLRGLGHAHAVTVQAF